MHKCQLCSIELFDDAVRTSEVTFTFEERYKAIGCQVCNVLPRTFSGKRQLWRYPPRRWVFFFRQPDRVTSARWARKINGPRNPEMFYITFDHYHLKPARARKSSVPLGSSPALGPGPGPWQGTHLTQCYRQNTINFPLSNKFLTPEDLLTDSPVFCKCVVRVVS
jgi:hypothetical protein